MAAHLYWIMALIFALILLVIIFTDYWTNSNPGRITQSYRMMLLWVAFFCIQDVIWGMCYAGVLLGDLTFFISSSIFHLATVTTTFFWMNYTLSYLGDSIKHRKLYLVLDLGVIVFETVLVIVNFFVPVLFRIENGHYVVAPLRTLTFFNQYIVYLTIGIAALFCSMHRPKQERERFFSVFIFATAPILLGIFQLLFPEGPFYSIGYFLGCFIVFMFIANKEREDAQKSRIITSLGDIYYTMHSINLENDTYETLVESKVIEDVTRGIYSAQQMVDAVSAYTVCDEYYEFVHEFLNLTTVRERLECKNSIACEFISKNYGWTRISFIPIERENRVINKIMLTTQIIDEEKKQQIDLVYKSNHDELTGLFNRRAYEEDLEKKKKMPLDNFVYIAMDLNGLKLTNDSLGHEAGDEIIKAAAKCMQHCFGKNGRVYRTGGDEFIILIDATEKQLEKIMKNFDDMVIGWKGKLADSFSVSTGIVTRKEAKDATLREMAHLADSRMYEEKRAFYRKKGVDRRGQRDAQTALCMIYTKILKINISTDTYEIITTPVSEQTREMGFDTHISNWMHNFAVNGLVHPEDLANYLEKTNLKFLGEYFAQGKSDLTVFYRRKIDGIYKQVMMEMIPTGEYSPENQSLFLYVKNIEK